MRSLCLVTNERLSPRLCSDTVQYCTLPSTGSDSGSNTVPPAAYCSDKHGRNTACHPLLFPCWAEPVANLRQPLPSPSHIKSFSFFFLQIQSGFEEQTMRESERTRERRIESGKWSDANLSLVCWSDRIRNHGLERFFLFALLCVALLCRGLNLGLGPCLFLNRVLYIVTVDAAHGAVPPNPDSRQLVRFLSIRHTGTTSAPPALTLLLAYSHILPVQRVS